MASLRVTVMPRRSRANDMICESSGSSSVESREPIANCDIRTKAVFKWMTLDGMIEAIEKSLRDYTFLAEESSRQRLRQHSTVDLFRLDFLSE